MATTTTIKQRILDALFEPEDPIDTNREIRRPETKVTIDKSIPKETSTIKATDLLYAKKEEEKPHESSAFIDLEEKKEETVVSSTQEEVYVSSPSLSPIFGAIEPKKKRETPTSVNYASIEKPASNVLGTVLSPIYGYDTKKANEARSTLVVDKKEQIKDTDITEDLGDIFATDEYKQFAKLKENIDDDGPFTKTSEIDLFSDFYLDKED